MGDLVSKSSWKNGKKRRVIVDSFKNFLSTFRSHFFMTPELHNDIAVMKHFTQMYEKALIITANYYSNSSIS
jgi:hypothetical protein